MSGGFHLQKVTGSYRRSKDLSNMGMQREEEWVVAAVERTEEYAESLTAAKRSDLLACLGIHDKNSWAHHAGRSTHAHVLRSLSVLSAPWLCLVRVRRSQRGLEEHRQHLVLRQARTHVQLERRQSHSLAKARRRTK